MGYIVDLTIVLEVLFWLKVAQPRNKSICEDDIMAAFGLYQGSPSHLEVHQQIRSYVDGMTLIDQVNPQDNTHSEIERLINSHRRVLIDTIFSDARRAPDAPSPSPSLSQPQSSSNAAQAGSRSHPGKQACSVSLAITTRRLGALTMIFTGEF
jgi:hypothetical protein